MSTTHRLRHTHQRQGVRPPEPDHIASRRLEANIVVADHRACRSLAATTSAIGKLVTFTARRCWRKSGCPRVQAVFALQRSGQLIRVPARAARRREGLQRSC